uniref:RING-type domain-containing protein n=1 Tax=Echinostoma caproni TaxID=27848 RepID=A0A183BCQ3_9TREM
LPSHSPIPLNCFDESDRFSDSERSSVSTVPMRLDQTGFDPVGDPDSKGLVHHSPIQAISISSTEALTNASSPMSRQSSEETVPMRLLATPSPPDLDRDLNDPLTVNWFALNCASSLYGGIHGGANEFTLAFDPAPWRYRRLSEPDDPMRHARQTIAPWRRVRSAPSLFICTNGGMSRGSDCADLDQLSTASNERNQLQEGMSTTTALTVIDLQLDESHLIYETQPEEQFQLASFVEESTPIYFVTCSVAHPWCMSCWVERLLPLADLDSQVAECSPHTESSQSQHVNLWEPTENVTSVCSALRSPDDMQLQSEPLAKLGDSQEKRTTSPDFSHTKEPQVADCQLQNFLPHPVRSEVTQSPVSSPSDEQPTVLSASPVGASSVAATDCFNWHPLGMRSPVDQSTCLTGSDGAGSMGTLPVKMSSRYSLTPESESRDLDGDEVVEPLSESSDFVSPDVNQLVGNCSSSSGSSGSYSTHTTLQMLLAPNFGMEPNANAPVVSFTAQASPNPGIGCDSDGPKFPPPPSQLASSSTIPSNYEPSKQIYPSISLSFNTSMQNDHVVSISCPTIAQTRSSSPDLVIAARTTMHPNLMTTVSASTSISELTLSPSPSTTPVTTIPTHSASRAAPRQRRLARHSSATNPTPQGSKGTTSVAPRSRKFVSTPVTWLPTSSSICDSGVNSNSINFFGPIDESASAISERHMLPNQTNAVTTTVSGPFHSTNLGSLPSTSGMRLNDRLGSMLPLCTDPMNYYSTSLSSYSTFPESTTYTPYTSAYSLSAPLGYNPVTVNEMGAPVFSTKTSYESLSSFDSGNVFHPASSEQHQLMQRSEDQTMFSSAVCSETQESYRTHYRQKTGPAPNNTGNFYTNPPHFHADYGHHSAHISAQPNQSMDLAHLSFTSQNGTTPGTVMDSVSCMNSAPIAQTNFITPMTLTAAPPSSAPPSSLQTPLFIEPNLTPCTTVAHTLLTGAPTYMTPVTVVPTTGPVTDTSTLTNW